MKIKALYFVTEKLVKIVTVKIDPKTGTAKMGKDKEFNFDKIEPLSLETGKLRKGLIPFYIMKHDIHKPLNVEFKKEKWKDDAAEMSVTPENFKNMMRQGTLNTLLTMSGPTTVQMFLWIAIGAIMGILAGMLIPFGGAV
jgi:hypothetical protein